MLPFFSPQKNSRETVLCRIILTVCALLFLLFSLLHSLPSPDTVKALLDENSLAGYESLAITTPLREPVLEEFYDRPQETTTAKPQSQTAPSKIYP